MKFYSNCRRIWPNAIHKKFGIDNDAFLKIDFKNNRNGCIKRKIRPISSKRHFDKKFVLWFFFMTKKISKPTVQVNF